MLLGLLRPSGGTAIVGGIDVCRNRIGAARKVGALLEAHGFYGNLSGRENLDLTRSLLGVPASEVDRVLEVVDMRGEAGRRVSDYSLGMRQRLGLARAMLGAPPVLVLEGELSRLKAELTPEIALRTDSPERAAEVLRHHDLTLVPEGDGLVVRLRQGQDADRMSATLNAALVQARVAVFAMGPRARSLEGIYRQVAAPSAKAGKEIA